MAQAQQPEKVSFWGRLKQIGMVFRFTARRDRLFVPMVVVGTVLPLGAGILMAVLGGSPFWLPIGFMISLLAVMIILNFRSRTAMLAEAEGQPGAAASIVKTIRGDWRVHAAVSATTQQDMVHLVIGRPGVILLGEGNPGRLRGLIAQQRKRLSRVIGNADLRDYVVGNDQGQLPLNKIQTTLLKLPRTISGKEVNALDKRVTALGTRPQMPKGAIPKNMRPPKMRGTMRPR
ncbi:MAG: DUF4191 domain-containing protein [Dactylosporangium sp.]|nr:DUF4191 domain-containing protein [Dactylosporangium sp.]NNJ59889.1 DUF4191 domain-containing protein [Dactylosporangium sp.]